jgi:hypothetical protein
VYSLVQKQTPADEEANTRQKTFLWRSFGMQHGNAYRREECMIVVRSSLRDYAHLLQTQRTKLTNKDALPDWNLGRTTGHPGWWFSWVSSIPPITFRKRASNWAPQTPPTASLPIRYSLLSYHSALYVYDLLIIIIIIIIAVFLCVTKHQVMKTCEVVGKSTDLYDCIIILHVM